MAEIVRGASPRPIQDPKWFNTESEVGWLRISDVTEQDGRVHYLEQRISEAGQEKTRVLTEPHLLLSIAATVGKPVINYVKTGVHDGFLIFQNPCFDREFMFQWLEMFRPQWQQFGQPGSQVNLNSDLVKNTEIMLPNEREQVRISTFFTALDRLITLHQRELNILEKVKQSLLQHMFIKGECKMSTSNEITSKLWEMANRLRGTMDASEYKNYILPFMFYRYLSERQDQYLKENHLEEYYTVDDDSEKEEYLEEISKGLGYAITPEYTWSKLVDRIEGHKIKASDFQDMFDSFNKNASRNDDAAADFANVLSDVNLGDSRLGASTNERAKALNDIVLLINDFTFKDEAGHDILGDVYEYLIGQFAANAGKKGGEFYTPHEVSQVLAKLVTLNAQAEHGQFRVYDPAMGSGSLLLTVQKELPNGDIDGSVDFYGQELNTTTYNIARMNLMMHGVNYRNMQLRRADTLDEDWPFDQRDGTRIPLQFDGVVANPPYSQNWDTKNIDREKDVRFKGYGVAPASKADYAFVLHGLYHLDNKGTMAIVLPHGVLFRGASEVKIRKSIIDNNLLDAVIGLPANLFYGTSIPTCVLVFKGVAVRNVRDIMIIDASNDFVKVKNQNKLRPEDITKIIETYKARQDVEKYAHVASLDEIVKNEYNLNIPRYVDTFEEEESVPLTQIAQELIDVRAEIDSTSANLFSMLSELQGTNNEAKAELDGFISLLKG